MSIGSDLKDFNQKCLKYLSLSWEVVEKAGNAINVGETFVLKFTLKNEFLPTDPKITFTEIRMWVNDTTYAEVVDTRQASWDLYVVRLRPGESATLFRRLRALSAADLWPFSAEEAALVRLEAFIDLPKTEATSREVKIKEQIRP